MNLWDILILSAVAAAVLFAVFRIRRRGGGCGCGCDGCGADCGKRQKE